MNQTRHFPAEATSVSQARRFVGKSLEEYSRDLVQSVELMVSELATNAVRHSHTGFEVDIGTTSDEVRVAVTDTGAGQPRKRSPAPTDPNGRGLQIVEALADRWEVNPLRPQGKTVSFVLSLSR